VVLGLDVLPLDAGLDTWFPAEVRANQLAPKAFTPWPVVSPAFWSLTNV
jgi:hypothetical protein